MKYEKKYWNSDKGKKKNENFPNDDNYRVKNRRYGKNEEGGGGSGRGYSNKPHHHDTRRSEKLHSDIISSNELNLEKSSYTPFSQNFKRNNNYEGKNKMLDKRGHRNNQYMPPSYKRGTMNQKANMTSGMKNNNSRFHKKYIRNSDERGLKFNTYESGDYNMKNNFDDDHQSHEYNYNKMHNYLKSDTYHAEDNNFHHSDNNDGAGANYDNYHDGDNGYSLGDYYYLGDNNDNGNNNNNDDHSGGDRFCDSYSRNYNHGKYNKNSSNSTIHHIPKNKYAYEDNQGNNYMQSYDEKYGAIRNDVCNHHDNQDIDDSKKGDVRQDLNNLHRDLHNLLFCPSKTDNEKTTSKTNTTPQNKDRNESVLSKLSILRNIPFNVKPSEKGGNKEEGNGSEEDNKHINNQRTERQTSGDEHKTNYNNKTAMILDDLKRCLYSSSNCGAKKTHAVSDDIMTKVPNRHDRETKTDQDYYSNSFVENDDNYFNVNNVRAYRKFGGSESSSSRSSSGKRHGESRNKKNCFPSMNTEKVNSHIPKANEEEENNEYNKSRGYRNASNYYKFGQVDDESSISNDGSAVMDAYKNEMKEDQLMNFSGNLFSKDQITESLKVLNTLQVDIERVCCYIKHFVDPPEQLFNTMIDVFLDKSVLVNSKIAIFYVYNHLIQELRNNYKNDLNKYYSIAEKGLHIFVVPVLRYILYEDVNVDMINKFYRCITIWNERNVYGKVVCDQLKSLQKNPHKKINFTVKNVSSQAHSLLSNELSKFVPLSFILKMPSINNEHKKALENKILSALFENISKDTLKGFDEKDIEEASKMSDKVMRMYGQELILINSQILELSSLINDNNDHLMKLHNALGKNWGNEEGK
ncbi:hypothetical protein, conserved [Plasmodium gonderi]|uniref:CID domain-containing protein n=1 Tax=Plasmodium gonderi TaxID=77519 RepID=A0A1Y1JFX5_PLAGO|nr:hypothetical protein, conserved [Plasmodium gonderi]GAW81170.1 hypothetical protein, conserved [Plasmodium gonderi]